MLARQRGRILVHVILRVKADWSSLLYLLQALGRGKNSVLVEDVKRRIPRSSHKHERYRSRDVELFLPSVHNGCQTRQYAGV